MSPRPSRSSAAAIRVGAGVLPDDRVVQRPAGAAVPDERGLALVGDADGGEVAGCSPLLPSAVCTTLDVRSQISTGLCSTQPARGRTCSCSSWWRATSAPAWSNTMNRVLVVPWSIAPTNSDDAAWGSPCHVSPARPGRSAARRERSSRSRPRSSRSRPPGPDRSAAGVDGRRVRSGPRLSLMTAVAPGHRPPRRAGRGRPPAPSGRGARSRRVRLPPQSPRVDAEEPAGGPQRGAPPPRARPAMPARARSRPTPTAAPTPTGHSRPGRTPCRPHEVSPRLTTSAQDPAGGASDGGRCRCVAGP